MLSLTFRFGAPADAPFLADLVRRAYRGEEGWTTEAAMLNDERIDTKTVLAKMQDPMTRVLVATDEQGKIVGCCEIMHKPENNIAYFGMFAVEPKLQAGRVGRQLLSHAEKMVVEVWNIHLMEMVVIAQREELIGWYIRRGYTDTKEQRPFPFDKLINGVALRDDLYFTVLVKTV
ncbi:Acetyltransferase protein [Mycena indigotica]|uniref:Acetyltransferase protein n=1 Tax=Mycena indigotica TaxID=2126181 RepID=A0A8H6SLX3_9AGAR|nr:Acetyltransferase protein [Mycena indigotica]KAF7301433.1 Acetyltransferase protein [Mycena indigotica]